MEEMAWGWALVDGHEGQQHSRRAHESRVPEAGMHRQMGRTLSNIRVPEIRKERGERYRASPHGVQAPVSGSTLL